MMNSNTITGRKTSIKLEGEKKKTTTTTWTTPAKDLLHPRAADMGTIATDMTTRSALQSANARASIETTFTRSEVMNSKKLGCGCGGRLPSSIGNDDRAPFPETLGGGDERRRRRRLPRVGRDRWPEKWEGRLGGDCRDRWRGPVGFSSGTEGGERARSMLSVGWSVREKRVKDGILDYILFLENYILPEQLSHPQPPLRKL